MDREWTKQQFKPVCETCGELGGTTSWNSANEISSKHYLVTSHCVILKPNGGGFK